MPIFVFDDGDKTPVDHVLHPVPRSEMAARPDCTERRRLQTPRLAGHRRGKTKEEDVQKTTERGWGWTEGVVREVCAQGVLYTDVESDTAGSRRDGQLDGGHDGGRVTTRGPSHTEYKCRKCDGLRIHRSGARRRRLIKKTIKMAAVTVTPRPVVCLLRADNR